jgi:hypothetical protein
LFTNQAFKGNKIKYGLFPRFLFAACLLFAFDLNAQEADTIVADTVVVDTSLAPFHSHRKAVLYSFICPGLGQVYNKKYWKIPFIYGGGGAFLYFINYNQLKYKKFRNALFDQKVTQEDVVIDGYPYRYESLGQGRDYYRRYRDLSVAGLAAIYLLNVIDAMVDAYFYYYDISDDLSLKVEPAVIQNIGLMGETASLGIRIHIGF